MNTLLINYIQIFILEHDWEGLKKSNYGIVERLKNVQIVKKGTEDNDENVSASSTYFTSQSPTHPAPERPNAWLRFNQIISQAQFFFHTCVEKHLGLMALDSKFIMSKMF